MIVMNKEIEELENYVINNKYEIGDLLIAMQDNYANDYDYFLTHEELEMLLNYIKLLQKFGIKYFELRLKNNKLIKE